MKKLLLFISLLFVFSFNVKAYENEYFKVTIPDDFKEEEIDENNVYKWSYKKQDIIITISDNVVNQNNIKSYDEEDINEEKDYLKKTLDESLSEYKVEVDVTSIKKDYLNDLDCIIYNTYWPTKKLVDYDTYQKGYIFTTSNYVTTVLFNSNSEINDDTEFVKNTISSLEILDDPIKDPIALTKMQLIIIITCGVICGIFGIIISLFKKKKKRK